MHRFGAQYEFHVVCDVRSLKLTLRQSLQIHACVMAHCYAIDSDGRNINANGNACRRPADRA